MAASNKIAPFSTRLAMILISILALGYIVIIGEKILAPLVFSFLCAILLLPFANFFELKLKLPRGGASLLSVLIFFTFLTSILYLVGSQITGLTHDWPLFKDQFNTSLNNLQNWVALHFHLGIQKQKNYINNTTSQVLSSGTSLIGSTLLSLSSILFFLA